MSAAIHRFSVGSITCTLISDGGAAFPAASVFAGAPEEERERELAERGIPADVPSNMNCLLIETGGQRILVDTGMGPFAPTTGKLQESLRAAGYEPRDIDTVIITHAHPDHIGGNVDAEGRPAFPAARYVMWEDEWRFWTDETVLNRLAAGSIYGLGQLEAVMADFARRHLQPIAGQLDLINRPGEIAPGVEAIPAPGHTLHHMALAISSGNERVLLPMDVALNPLHLERPSWGAALDQDRALAEATRRRFFAEAAADDALLFVYHFPFPGLGRVTPHGEGWRWEPATA
ncbi:MBL fold metallo-hydrolase [Sphaerobacter thermophilus]|uniref:Beta-lactamase domain protein n=1 Tax=Sphaerobacter thermophilus (strain ATCC 49802 / DSM 20745 / KCCM 41009 / NCIMB 13125 / S 6022) TaxID=479434 RepID=D1C6V0_SPHTD|nr:MBL fold metallo-hydrolase [Sphaerobacter thermophilus]ACZ37711.1 beta-lactamase domain protein [Sphaerobacter thermophilus DSM 20745]